MAPTRVIVIGSGFIAGEHLSALNQLPDAEVAGIVDLDPGRAAAAARAAGGVPWGTDLAAAITDWSADAAIVCTPNFTHPAIGRTLAEAGVHALIEKPLAITPGEAAELVELFEGRGLVLSAAHTHRYAPYARAVRQAITDGAVGRPLQARITLLGGWIWGDWRNWQIDRKRSGGHALHNGVHLLDLVTWWLGDTPTHVHAYGRKRAAADLEVHDYLMITVGYASGASAVCEMSRGQSAARDRLPGSVRAGRRRHLAVAVGQRGDPALGPRRHQVAGRRAEPVPGPGPDLAVLRPRGRRGRR